MPKSTFVWDTTGLLHAGACDRVDVLLDAAGPLRQHIVPAGVAMELTRIGHRPSDERLQVLDLSESEEIATLSKWMILLGSSVDGKNSGEAWVAAVAESQNAVAIIDDQQARRVIQQHSQDLEVHGVLWAISRGVVEERVQDPQAYTGLCDQMLNAYRGNCFSELRWPFGVGGYPEWYAKERRRGSL